MKTYLFESERLGFREFESDDLKEIVRMNADPEVMTYFPAPMTISESKNYMNNAIIHQESFGFSKYAVDIKITGQFLGIIGLVKIDFESELFGEVEIGWRLLKEHWHKGYAVEGARATLEYGHDQLNIPIIYSFTASVNTPSKKVMDRIGMDYVCEFEYPNVPSDSILKNHVLYKSSSL